ncbi:MAG: hypothetical protein ACFCD0_02260 [Gemmataceae bacterium]
MPTNELKDVQGKILAQKHYAVEPGLARIYRLTREGYEDDPEEPIKLLEVNKLTVPSGIMPLRFGPRPDAGIDFAMIILEVTPDEYDQIRAQELQLPNDWQIGELIAKVEEAEAQ